MAKLDGMARAWATGFVNDIELDHAIKSGAQVMGTYHKRDALFGGVCCAFALNQFAKKNHAKT